MLDQSRFSYLIELTQKLINAVKTMKSGYEAFPALIAAEHEMIRSHTYTQRLEETMQAKTEASESISQSFEELQQLSQQVYMIWGELDCIGQASYPGDLSNCKAMLSGILDKLLQSGLSELQSGVLQSQIEAFGRIHQDFKDTADRVKPLIEVNRAAITQVAHNYQLSTKILFEMAEQIQSTYTAQGQQAKPVMPSSTIAVKA